MQTVSHIYLGRSAVLSQLSAVEIMLLSDADCQSHISREISSIIPAIIYRDYAAV
jgi:hypothetical protein